ncbi:uncharacterized protein LOC141856482 isoform X2 [Brevipalpus obovatus]|uniref:uncharacterized protein LOC141856482 isoform X2 n=1 Tax=Brevipalpus obovatus TaxID=246614 RepID=UPI003D9E709B
MHSLSGDSCDRSHHSHHHGSHHHHHHRHHRGRSPSSAGRSSPASEVSSEQAKSRMRWILSLGLLLPALAAIIGVVAWAVSAEVVMGARRDSAFKLSGPASRFHQSARHNDEDTEIDRLELKMNEQEGKSSRTMSRKAMVKESQISESRADLSPKATSKSESTDQNKNANLYFLTGLDTLNSENRPSFSSLSALDAKKSTGARVAEVIDRLVSQRKSEGSSPHIVVVAPIADSKKRSQSSPNESRPQTTSTQAPPSSTTDSSNPSSESSPTASSTSSPSSSASSGGGRSSRDRTSSFESASFTRDSDTLLAAAQYLARHHIANKRNDEDRFTLSLEPSRDGNRNSFESANLLGPQASDDQETDEYEPAPSRGQASRPMGPSQHYRRDSREKHSHQHHHHQQPSQHQSHHHQQQQQHGGSGDVGGGMEESIGHPMASASQQHVTYLPSNRMGQAPAQMMQNQIQYRSGQGHPQQVLHGQQVAQGIPQGPQSQIPQALPGPQGPQGPQGPPQMYGPIPQAMLRNVGGNGNPQQSFMPPPNIPNLQYQPPPQQGHQNPQLHPSQQQQQQMQQQQQPQIIFENGQQFIVSPNPNLPGHIQVNPVDPNQPGSNMASSQYAPVFEPANQGGGPVGPPQPMGHPQRPQGQYINRDSYVAQESAGPPPLIDFSAQQLPDDEPGGYQESAPAKGITLHFGGGPMGGGGQVMTSPLGIFKTLLLPLLPKPRMNLNGKVVFGVVLEKGVGFGKQKHHSPHPFHLGKRR